MRPSPHNSKEKTRRTPRRRSLPPALRHPADTYSGLDRFGRVKKQLWRYYGGTPADRDRFEYTYDRNSNRTSKDLTLTTGKDEKYAYDGLNRLTAYDRGTLSGGDITSKVRNEAWGLSPTGNWSDYQIDADGDGNYTDATDLDQDRTHNLVNEIYNETAGAAITEGQGQSAWADPAYSARGNMTTVPKPTALTSTYACKYDAWNRLTEVKSGEIVVAKYEYDALNRRTKECVDTDTDGDFDEFRHFYYTDGWQLLETRLSESENTDPETLYPEYQYVWSLRYMDAPVLRDKNTDTDDLCDDERLYYTNDANMNVTALLATDGTPLERYIYDPYGKVTIYDDDWSETRNTSSYDNRILFAGYYFDNETGLYHIRNRYYHPYFGWIIRDGGYWDGISLYEYVQSNPLCRVDALGLDSVAVYDKNESDPSLQEAADDYDHAIGVTSAKDAATKLGELKSEGTSIDELHIFDHGTVEDENDTTGRQELGNRELKPESPEWKDIAGSVSPDGTIELEGCRVGAEPDQIQKFADEGGRTVTAHTGKTYASRIPIPGLKGDHFHGGKKVTKKPTVERPCPGSAAAIGAAAGAATGGGG